MPNKIEQGQPSFKVNQTWENTLIKVKVTYLLLSLIKLQVKFKAITSKNERWQEPKVQISSSRDSIKHCSSIETQLYEKTTANFYGILQTQ